MQRAYFEQDCRLASRQKKKRFIHAQLNQFHLNNWPLDRLSFHSGRLFGVPSFISCSLSLRGWNRVALECIEWIFIASFALNEP